MLVGEVEALVALEPDAAGNHKPTNPHKGKIDNILKIMLYDILA